MEQIKQWFFEKMNEFILFLEYPLDYIEEFGDELKSLRSGEKAVKIGKALISIYLCVLLIQFVLFAVLLFLFLGSKSSRENAYTRELKAERDDAMARGNWDDVAVYNQMIRNSENRGEHYED